MAYPPGWARAHGDFGTATAEVRGSDERIVGYLNITPKQGPESLANWSHFRADHNGHEGDREVKVLASATKLRFLTGTGSCVEDRYKTTTSPYIELACIVAGKRGTTVIVGAAPPQAWSRVSPLLERAISALRT